MQICALFYMVYMTRPVPHTSMTLNSASPSRPKLHKIVSDTLDSQLSHVLIAPFEPHFQHLPYSNLYLIYVCKHLS